MSARKVSFFSVLLLGAAVYAVDNARGAPPSVEDVNAQYSAVMRAMKNPIATGVLVTEIGPESPAGAAGLRGGDIILKLDKKDARTLASIRTQMADLIAAKLVDGEQAKVPLVVRRNNEATPAGGAAKEDTLTFEIPREPLGIRAVEVQAGVPARLNPPASARGTITLAWKDLRDLQNAGGDLGQNAFLRTFDPGGQGEEGSWIGWQKRAAVPTSDDGLSGTLDIYHISVAEGAKDAEVVRSESITFTIRTGDYKSTPAFVLDSVELKTKSADGTALKASATRAGNVMRTKAQASSTEKIEPEVNLQRESAFTTLIPSALPLVASAMPQQKDAVLGINLMSIRDFVARPGYVLATRGKQLLPSDEIDSPVKPDAPQAWRVDLLHCGVLVESYWFSDKRKLLRVDSVSGTRLVSRRVASEQEAKSSAEENPFKKPGPRVAPPAP